jgi:hypothetical protein
LTLARDPAPRFADDGAFLRKHVKVGIVSDPVSAAQVAVNPAYQCRVTTSTAGDWRV